MALPTPGSIKNIPAPPAADATPAALTTPATLATPGAPATTKQAGITLPQPGALPAGAAQTTPFADQAAALQAAAATPSIEEAEVVLGPTAATTEQPVVTTQQPGVTVVTPPADTTPVTPPPTANVPPQTMAQVTPPTQTLTPPAQPLTPPTQTLTPPPAPAQNMPVPGSNAGVPAVGGKKTSMIQMMEDQGFYGLDDAQGVYNYVSLKDFNFRDSDGEDLGTEIFCIIFSSEPKWILKVDAVKKKNLPEDFVYSKDKVHATNGKPIQDYINRWEAAGYDEGYWKSYLDCPAQLVNRDGTLGELVMLSIPSSSKGRFAKYFGKLAAKQVNIRDSITLCKAGPEVTSVQHPFKPWAFQYVQPAPQTSAG